MDLVISLANRLNSVCRHRRAYVWLISIVQLGLFALGSLLSFLLRFEFAIPREMLSALWWGSAILVSCKALIFYLYGLNRGLWRYFAVSDTIRIVAANLAAS